MLLESISIGTHTDVSWRQIIVSIHMTVVERQIIMRNYRLMLLKHTSLWTLLCSFLLIIDIILAKTTDVCWRRIIGYQPVAAPHWRHVLLHNVKVTHLLPHWKSLVFRVMYYLSEDVHVSSLLNLLATHNAHLRDKSAPTILCAVTLR